MVHWFEWCSRAAISRCTVISFAITIVGTWYFSFTRRRGAADTSGQRQVRSPAVYPGDHRHLVGCRRNDRGHQRRGVRSRPRPRCAVHQRTPRRWTRRRPRRAPARLAASSTAAREARLQHRAQLSNPASSAIAVSLDRGPALRRWRSAGLAVFIDGAAPLRLNLGDTVVLPLGRGSRSPVLNKNDAASATFLTSTLSVGSVGFLRLANTPARRWISS